jgi:argininosuccinate synthase
MRKETIIVGFSGGLDTSFFVPYLKEEYKKQGVDLQVITVTVNTGGFTKQELKMIERRSKEVGANKHYAIDAQQEFYDNVVTYIIKTNSQRWHKYPLCVAAERLTQAIHMVRIAEKEGTKMIGHGSTGAGNDQFRFDGYIYALMPDAKIIAPTRERNFSRAFEADYLKKKGIAIEEKKKNYSYNIGLLGTSIGGKETKTTWDVLPDVAYLQTTSPIDAPDEPHVFEIMFEKGIPVGINGMRKDPLTVWKEIDILAAGYGVGRDVYVGDTTMNTKGRIGFEASAATVIIEAHRALEAIILSKKQFDLAQTLAHMYSDIIYHAHYFDSARRDIEAAVDSMQKTVTGKVKICLYKGSAKAIAAHSLFSLVESGVVYGEDNAFMTGKEVEGACKLHALSGIACHKRDERL